jgi:hypothetical protein
LEIIERAKDMYKMRISYEHNHSICSSLETICHPVRSINQLTTVFDL